jgi:hypothetical protein
MRALPIIPPVPTTRLFPIDSLKSTQLVSLFKNFSFGTATFKKRSFVEPSVRWLKAADFSPKKLQEPKAQGWSKIRSRYILNRRF